VRSLTCAFVSFVAEYGLFAGQFVCVAFKGLVDCPNLRAVAGPSVDQLKAGCGRWWLGRVEAYWLKDSEERIVPAAFTNSGAEDMHLEVEEQRRKETKRRQKKRRKPSPPEALSSDDDEDSDEGFSSSPSSDSSSDVDDDEPEQEKAVGASSAGRSGNSNSSKRPRPVKGKGRKQPGKKSKDDKRWKLKGQQIEWVEVCWYGQPSADGERMTCHGDLPMEVLLKCQEGTTELKLITDKVARHHICFEESEPGKVRFTRKGALHKTTARVMRDHAPNMEVNQAGEEIDAKAGIAAIAGYEETWEATLAEVKGFQWTVRDPTLPEELQEECAVVYTVKGIYAWAGQLFATVQVDDDQNYQHDHLVEEIRERRHFDSVGHRLVLPDYLRWPAISSSMFAVDYGVIHDNVKCYMQSLR